MKLPLLLAAVAGVAALGLTACDPPADTYVSLGDSMVSGPLVPNQRTDPAGCLRSDRNAASLVAPKIKTTRFIDVSCSGAETWYFTHEQPVTGGTNPPQFDVLDRRTKVVTVGIGGNDIGFGEIVSTCMSRMVTFQTCNEVYRSGGNDEISNRIAALRPKLDAAFAEIKQRAPHAAVFVIPYLPMLPSSGGCAPISPFNDDVTYLRAKLNELNASSKAAALAAGFVYIDAVANATGHDMCKPAGTKWIEGLIPSNVAAPFHPNADGYAGEAPMIAAAINARVPS